MEHEHNHNAVNNNTKNQYLPLVIILLIIIVGAYITSRGGDIDTFLLDFMAGFFLVFAGFKLIDLRGFAAGYATYDLFAKRTMAYAYAYPFIELAFGFAMLSNYHPDWLLWAEVALMVFGGIGVLYTIKKEKGIKCVCLGTVLKTPLTTVTVIENFWHGAVSPHTAILENPASTEIKNQGK